MNAACLVVGDDNVANLSGELDFSSVPGIWQQLKSLVQLGKIDCLSLTGVESSNSAALAMLIEARALAESSRQSLQIVDLPRGLKDLAAMSNVLALIETT